MSFKVIGNRPSRHSYSSDWSNTTLQ